MQLITTVDNFLQDFNSGLQTDACVTARFQKGI